MRYLVMDHQRWRCNNAWKSILKKQKKIAKMTKPTNKLNGADFKKLAMLKKKKKKKVTRKA